MSQMIAEEPPIPAFGHAFRRGNPADLRKLQLGGSHPRDPTTNYGAASWRALPGPTAREPEGRQ
jgi:hypothetical protein